MNDVVIRPLRTEDAPQWRRLRLEALELCPTAFSTSYEEASRQDVAAFASHIPPPGRRSVLLGAFRDDVLLGTAGVHVPATAKLAHKGELWGVYVAPAMRGRGVAAALVRAAIEHARTRVAVLQLAVGTDNTSARALYHRLGFVPYGLERRAMRVAGQDYDDELLALDFIDPAQ